MTDPQYPEDAGAPQRSSLMRARWRLAAIPVSLTWAYADWRKASMTDVDKRAFLRRMNRCYMWVAIVLAVLLGLRSGNELSVVQQPDWLSLPLLPLFFPMWRCNEIFYAFYRDAFDRLDPSKTRGSTLTWSERVRLALNSYVELILNFAMIYAIIPACEWTTSPHRFTDVLSYSATTITTSGGGALFPDHWPLQIMTSYEIFCGLILLVVCFAIYAGRGVEEVARRDLQRDIAAALAKTQSAE